MGVETALIIGAAATLAATAVGTVGHIQAGRAASKQAEAEAESQARQFQEAGTSAAFERDVELEQGQVAEAEATSREEAVRRDARRTMARQRAATAESGVDMGFGSSLDLLERSEIDAELDALTARYEGALAKRGARLQASQYERERGSAERAAGETLKAGKTAAGNARQQALIGAGSTLLSGLSSASYGYRTKR